MIEAKIIRETSDGHIEGQWRGASIFGAGEGIFSKTKLL